MRKYIAITSIFLALPVFSFSQDVGSWWMYYGLNRIHDNWSVWTEVQYRSHDNGSNIEQLLLRTSINYHLSAKSYLALGYGYVGSYSLETDIENPTYEEGRIYEQYLLKHNAPFSILEHRFRLEQRLFQGVYLNRIRYRLFVTIPINNKKLESKTWFLGIYDEIFLNTVEEYFDRNRFYFALGYQVNDFLNIQSGMMNQLTQSRDKWYFQLSMTWNPDLRKDQ